MIDIVWVNIGCNAVIALCLILMPIFLRELFRRRKIGFSLDGWFPAISAVMLCSSVFWILDACETWMPGWVVYELPVKLMIATASLTATCFLFFRERKLVHDPRGLHEMISDFDKSLEQSKHA